MIMNFTPSIFNIDRKGYFQNVGPRRITIRKNDSTLTEVENLEKQ